MRSGFDTAHSIQMTAYGAPGVLVWAAVDLPPLRPDEVRIRTIAAAVNFTDLEIRAGHWPIRKPDPFPYTPGVEVVGEIAEIGSQVTSLVPGERVMTMMQGLGGVRGERPGGYAQYVTVAAEAVAPTGPVVDPCVMAAFGLGGVTAFEGLLRLGPLAGRQVMVTGAAGGVGSAAVTLAKAQGATVTGIVTRAAQAEYVRSLGADDIIVCPRGAPADFGAARVDGILDTVGAPLFAQCLGALNPGGTLSLVGAVGGSDVRFDLWDLIRPVTLTGYSSESLDGAALRRAVAALAGWIADGTLTPPRFQTLPLTEAARAHALLEGRGVTGRVLLVP